MLQPQGNNWLQYLFCILVQGHIVFVECAAASALLPIFQAGVRHVPRATAASCSAAAVMAQPGKGRLLLQLQWHWALHAMMRMSERLLPRCKLCCGRADSVWISMPSMMRVAGHHTAKFALAAVGLHLYCYM
jgi:hypothetical protein